MIHRVDLVIQPQHPLCHIRIGLNERLQCLAHHVRRERRETGNVNRQIGRG